MSEYIGNYPTKSGAVVNADEIPLLDSQDLSSGRKKVKKVTAANLKSSIGGVQSIVAGSGVTVNNADPANPVISASGGAGGGTKYKVVTLTAAQVLAGIFPTGIELLPAPGENKAIVVDKINVQVANGGTPYNATGVGRICLTTLTGFSFINILQDHINTTGKSPSIDYGLTYVPVNPADVLNSSLGATEINAPLVFGFFPGVGPSEGTKSITFHIYYSIAELEA